MQKIKKKTQKVQINAQKIKVKNNFLRKKTQIQYNAEKLKKIQKL